MPSPLNKVSLMPQMSAAFSGWMQKISLLIVTQKQIDGFIKETSRVINFEGVIQPLKNKDIKQYPEGQWQFKWLQIHCVGKTIEFQDNDRISYEGGKYKVMGFKDYSLNNYAEYHAVEDFT